MQSLLAVDLRAAVYFPACVGMIQSARVRVQHEVNKCEVSAWEWEGAACKCEGKEVGAHGGVRTRVANRAYGAELAARTGQSMHSVLPLAG